MNAQELKERYANLYDTMKYSGKTENMKLFGSVMNEMMDYIIQKNPSDAEKWIDKLASIEWKNYLTPSEAEEIVSNMIPEAPWSREVWNKAMDSYGLEKMDKPYYNSCALWVTMNMIMSDHSQTLAKAMGVEPENIPVEVIYRLAVDLLRDKDGRFNVRTYFCL